MPGLLHELEEHFHSEQMVYPDGAGVTVTSAGGAWTLGDFSADIVAAGALSHPFDLHWVECEPAANTSYIVIFYYGATDIECGRVLITRVNPNLTSISKHIQTPILPKGSRVRAKCKDSVGGNAIVVHVFLHDYT